MTRRTHGRNRNPLGLMALEPRWMFDGAAAVDASHADSAIPTPVEVKAADPSRNNGRKEVVFVDTSVTDYKTLEAAVKDGIGIVEIDGSKDGLAQLAKWSETHTGYDSISILGHGLDGVQKIGATALSSALIQDAQANEWLAEIGASLTPDGDIRLYGCDVAKSESGQQFVKDLAAATGADVAASTDVTGKSGDWALEYTHGDSYEIAPLDIGKLSFFEHELSRSASMNGASQSGSSLLVRFTYNFSTATETCIYVQRLFGDSSATEYFLGNNLGCVDN